MSIYEEKLIRLVSHMVSGSKEMTDELGYKCIPRDLSLAGNAYRVAVGLRPETKVVCDFGCGFGAALMTMQDYSSSKRKYIGIEFREYYRKPFNLLLNTYLSKNSEFILKDLTEITIEYIEDLKIDIAYLYEPLADYDQLIDLESKILEAKIPIIMGISKTKTSKYNYKSFYINGIYINVYKPKL